MKKTIALALAASMGMQLSAALAQHPHREGGKPEPRPDITELVSDLNATQKRKLETITAESRTASSLKRSLLLSIDFPPKTIQYKPVP